MGDLQQMLPPGFDLWLGTQASIKHYIQTQELIVADAWRLLEAHDDRLEWMVPIPAIGYGEPAAIEAVLMRFRSSGGKAHPDIAWGYGPRSRHIVFRGVSE